MAVAGFAAANVMLLSVSVWSGADQATGNLFHWLSALIALPAAIYAGRPFFRSALHALGKRRLNMDVPISLAVVLACGMSLYQTMNMSGQVYFDAAVMLLFFLLAGRVLDQRMRQRARAAAQQLTRVFATPAKWQDEDGQVLLVPANQLKPQDIVIADAGDRVSADGIVVSGRGEIDLSLLTGETVPQPVGPGDTLYAGSLVVGGTVRLEIVALGRNTFLSSIVDLMDDAARAKAAYARLADRAAGLYAPLVHGLALLAFVGWLVLGAAVSDALMIAISVLIITCPCALGLAVPVVQVVAGGALFRKGVLVKNGTALEKLGEVDVVVFDKTGTLTRGQPRLACEVPDDLLAVAAGLARSSAHPFARAILRVADARGIKDEIITRQEEIPGRGIEGHWRGKQVRLGRPDMADGQLDGPNGLASVLTVDGAPVITLHFEDGLKQDAGEVIEALKMRGVAVEMLSGDRHGPASRTAGLLGIDRFEAPCLPQDKLKRLHDLAALDHKVLMVGDGLNDGPALAAAHVSMAPSTASDLGRNTADLVMLRQGLSGVVQALDIGRRSRRLIMQNFALAALYNAIAVPVAVMGLASPVIAAIAMSLSSLLVIGNALRLEPVWRRPGKQRLRRLPVVPAGDAP
jgi:Cu2+-exporting ATPase